MSRGTALGRVTKCLKDHHVDTTKKLKKAPKEWQELFICDRESHEREGEARIFHVGLEDVGIGELADRVFRVLRYLGYFGYLGYLWYRGYLGY